MAIFHPEFSTTTTDCYCWDIPAPPNGICDACGSQCTECGVQDGHEWDCAESGIFDDEEANEHPLFAQPY